MPPGCPHCVHHGPGSALFLQPLPCRVFLVLRRCFQQWERLCSAQNHRHVDYRAANSSGRKLGCWEGRELGRAMAKPLAVSLAAPPQAQLRLVLAREIAAAPFQGKAVHLALVRVH